MPTHMDRKRLVHERVRRSGELYTTARQPEIRIADRAREAWGQRRAEWSPMLRGGEA